MQNPIEVMALVLQINHPDMKQPVRIRYAKVLVQRAVRFYIENTLDSGVVEEDMVPGNMTESEEIEKNYYRELKNTYKELSKLGIKV